MKPTPIRPVLVSPKSLAHILDVSRSYAYELIARGEFEVVRLDTAIRVTAVSVDAFIERSRVASGERSAS